MGREIGLHCVHARVLQQRQTYVEGLELVHAGDLCVTVISSAGVDRIGVKGACTSVCVGDETLASDIQVTMRTSLGPARVGCDDVECAAAILRRCGNSQGAKGRVLG